jgi:WD40 repeat protein
MIHREIDAMLECLYEEEGVSPPERRHSRSFPQANLPSSDSTLSVPMLPRLSPRDWIEDSFSTPNLSPKEESLDIAIKPRRWFPTSSPACYSADFSPDCQSAIFLTGSVVRIFSLRDPQSKLLLERTLVRSKSSYKVAVASNRFLAVVTDDHLRVYEYGPSIPGGVEVGTETFSSDSSESTWGPDCAAIHETKERIWITVGGRGTRKHHNHCSIKMYRVDATAGSFVLTAQGANFARQNCFTHQDPLSDDFLKMISFSPDGGRLVAVTNSNRALLWFLSNNGRPRHAPFELLIDSTTVCASRIIFLSQCTATAISNSS